MSTAGPSSNVPLWPVQTNRETRRGCKRHQWKRMYDVTACVLCGILESQTTGGSHDR